MLQPDQLVSLYGIVVDFVEGIAGNRCRHLGTHAAMKHVLNVVTLSHAADDSVERDDAQ